MGDDADRLAAQLEVAESLINRQRRDLTAVYAQIDTLTVAVERATQQTIKLTAATARLQDSVSALAEQNRTMYVVVRVPEILTTSFPEILAT